MSDFLAVMVARSRRHAASDLQPRAGRIRPVAGILRWRNAEPTVGSGFFGSSTSGSSSNAAPYVTVSRVSDHPTQVARRAGRPAHPLASAMGRRLPGRPADVGRGRSHWWSGLAAGSQDLPRHDDWVYRRIALDLASRGVLSLHSVTTMLVGQIILVQPFLRIFGLQSAAFSAFGAVVGRRSGARLVRVGSPVPRAWPGRARDGHAPDLSGLPGVRDIVHDRRADARARADLPRPWGQSRCATVRCGSVGCWPPRRLDASRSRFASSRSPRRWRCCWPRFAPNLAESGRGPWPSALPALVSSPRGAEVDPSRTAPRRTRRLRQHGRRPVAARRGTGLRVARPPAAAILAGLALASDLEPGRRPDRGRAGHRRGRLPALRVVPERHDPAGPAGSLGEPAGRCRAGASFVGTRPLLFDDPAWLVVEWHRPRRVRPCPDRRGRNRRVR